MNENVNLLELSYDDINGMRKNCLMDKIKKTKVQVIFGTSVKDLCWSNRKAERNP